MSISTAIKYKYQGLSIELLISYYENKIKLTEKMNL